MLVHCANFSPTVFRELLKRTVSDTLQHDKMVQVIEPSEKPRTLFFFLFFGGRGVVFVAGKSFTRLRLGRLAAMRY